MGRLNYAQQTNFIAGIPKLDNIHLYLTNAICPGVNLNLVEAYNQGMKTILAADGISYNSASFNAILDEDFKVYETIINNLQDENQEQMEVSRKQTLICMLSFITIRVI